MSRYGWGRYVPVAERRAKARKKMEALRKKGLDVSPVEIEGGKIARTFWGKAWCEHLESFSDYENRLPRGRTYVRNGSVCHLEIATGEIKAMVSGSELYTVKIGIKTLSPKKWRDVKSRCAGQIGSLIELLLGRLSENVMAIVTDRDKGLFPLPGEIRLSCSCPDWAFMCKHVAAVLYGVGTRLDESPELLFRLRGVDHEELIAADVKAAAAVADSKGDRRRIADDDLAAVFGIEMLEDAAPEAPARGRKKTAPKSSGAPGVKPKKTAKPPAKSTVKGRRSAGKRDGAKGKRTPHAAVKIGPVTGRAVAKLRKKFGMTQSEFAKLLGVSVPTIGNWEKKPGKLDLQARSLDAWNAANELTKTQARLKLDGA